MSQFSITQQNLKFLSLGSEPVTIPKEYQFFRKYFKTKDQREFFDYYFIFRSTANFVSHTGIRIVASSLSKLKSKFEWLWEEYHKAKANMDLETLSKIKRRRLNLLKRLR